MKHPVLALLGLLAVAAAVVVSPAVQAVEILRWERMPLAVPLKVGQERIVFIDRNVRVGVPAGVGERLRVQSAGGAVYLRASEPIEPTRLQLQDADTGALHYAAGGGRLRLVRLLLEAGARVDRRDPVTGRTPLHAACDR